MRVIEGVFEGCQAKPGLWVLKKTTGKKIFIGKNLRFGNIKHILGRLKLPQQSSQNIKQRPNQ